MTLAVKQKKGLSLECGEPGSRRLRKIRLARSLQNLIYPGGADSSLVKWVDCDSVGRTVRSGLNFTERGFGGRAARRRAAKKTMQAG
jgi:hypothetical protein